MARNDSMLKAGMIEQYASFRMIFTKELLLVEISETSSESSLTNSLADSSTGFQVSLPFDNDFGNAL